MKIFGHGDLEPGNLINSRESFARVRTLGADGVELDVRVTADGTLVVIHDPELPDGRAIRDATREDIPTDLVHLDEALDLCDGMVDNIEVKNYPQDDGYDPEERVSTLTVALLEEREWRDDVIVSSFGLGCLDRIVELAPAVATAFLVLSRREPEEVMAPIRASPLRIIHPYVSMVDERFMKVARSLELSVNVWTGSTRPTTRFVNYSTSVSTG